MSFLVFSDGNGQTFGFGCLGLSGFYGGVSQYNYEAKGLNESLALSLIATGIEKSKYEFKQGTGFRVGANIFRAKWEGVFVSAKGFFQFMRESHEFNKPNSGQNEIQKYQLILNHWGVGIDLGFPILKILDLKLVDGGVTFYNSEFKSEEFSNGQLTNEFKYEPEKTKIGYYIGSGLIFHLIPDYISVEGTLFYNFFQIDKMAGDNNFVIPSNPASKNLIEKGGLSATLQLNLGFPL